MTLIIEAPPRTVVIERPIPRPAAGVEAPTSWASAAVRAHALLSQTMPDEEIDDLVDAGVRLEQAVVLPRFLFG